jgi:uncharacterized protein (DUF2147 family)
LLEREHVPVLKRAVRNRHRSTLTLLSRDALEVEGCRLFFCRSETWTRTN